MSHATDTPAAPRAAASAPQGRTPLGSSCLIQPPLLRAHESARNIFVVILYATAMPLAAGVVFFGWRALLVIALSVASCAMTERLYYRVTRVPALLGRSHAYLTGMLLALTLPAFVPWYVPVVAGVFAILVGKAIFGGVGHFLWQPALVGRLAVAVMFSSALTMPFPSHGDRQPLLAQSKIIAGDLMDARVADGRVAWRGRSEIAGSQAFLVTPPAKVLDNLTKPAADEPLYNAIAFGPEIAPEQLAPMGTAALAKLPPINDLLYGARPGGIGETSALLILVAGLYLVYRNYIKWQLPVMFLVSACAVAALAPVQLQVGGEVVSGWGPPGGWSLGHLAAPLEQWTLPPLLAEGLDAGVLYVVYQLLSSEFLVAAFFLATEMTSRPVTRGGQVIFATGCGVLGMLLRLYVNIPIPVYAAVLIMNTFTPLIDSFMRPRVFGQPRLARLRGSAAVRSS